MKISIFSMFLIGKYSNFKYNIKVPNLGCPSWECFRVVFSRISETARISWHQTGLETLTRRVWGINWIRLISSENKWQFFCEHGNEHLGSIKDVIY